MKIMLKIYYTEMGLHIEQLDVAIEEFIAQRLTLAVRLTESLFIEPNRLVFDLLPNIPILRQLRILIEKSKCKIGLSLEKKESAEITVQGLWISSNPSSHQGMFVVTLNNDIEFLIYELWQCTQCNLCFIS